MKLSFDELYQIVYTNHNDGGLTGASIVESSTRIAKALEAALAQQEPPCNNPLRSEITCADLVRDNDNLREALAQAKALYLEEIHTRTLAQQAQPEWQPELDAYRAGRRDERKRQHAQPLPGRLFEEWMDANMERPADPRTTFYSEDDVRIVWNAAHQMAQQAQPETHEPLPQHVANHKGEPVCQRMVAWHDGATKCMNPRWAHQGLGHDFQESP